MTAHAELVDLLESLYSVLATREQEWEAIVLYRGGCTTSNADWAINCWANTHRRVGDNWGYV